MAIPDLVARIRLDTSQLQRGLAGVKAFGAGIQGTAAGASKSIDNLGNKLANVGASGRQGLDLLGKAGIGVGVGIAAGFGVAAKAAIDFESAFAGVNKTVNASATELEGLREGILELSRVTPASAVEIAGVAEAAGALGVAKEDILAFSRTVIQLAETTNLSADAAATGLARFANIFQTPQKDIDNLASSLVNLGNKGASTEDEILEFGLRLAGAGKQAGLSEGEVLGFGNALASVGVQAEAGGTAFSKVFTSINDAVIDSNENLETFAQVAGVSAQEFARAFREDPAAAIDSFIQGVGRISEAGESTTAVFEKLGLTDQRLMSSVLRLAGAGDVLTQSLRDGNDGFASSQALLTEYNKRLDTTGAKLEIARNNLNTAAIAIGDDFLPAISGAAQGVAQFFGALQSLPGPLRGLGEGLTAAIGAMGLLGGAAIVLAPRLIAINRALIAMGPAGASAAAGLRAAGAIAAVFAGATAAVHITNKLRESIRNMIDPDVSSDVSKLSESLNEFGERGRVAGELARSFGDDLQGLIKDFEQGADLSFGDKFFGSPDKTHEAKENLDDLDDALTRITQISPDQGQQAYDRLFRTLREGGVPVKAIEEGLNDSKEALDGFAAAENIAGTAGEGAAAGAEGAGDAFGDMGANAEEAQAQIDKLTEALEGNVQAAFGAQSAEADYQQAVDDLAESVRTNGATLDLQNQAGRENFAILEQMGQATFGVVQAQAEAGVSGRALNDVLVLQRAKFVEGAVAAGISRDVANSYADALFRVPEDVTTAIHVENMEASRAAISRFIELLNAIPESKDVTVRINLATLNKDALAIPKRQFGGPVVRGNPYIVGENGPELFFPKMSGRIIPNNRMDQTSGTVQNANNTYNQQVIVNEQVSPRRVAEEMAWLTRTSGV